MGFKTLTPEQREARNLALQERTERAQRAITDPDAFVRFEAVVRNLPRKWTLRNALLLWVQSEEKGIALADVRDFGGWLAVGRVPAGKGTGMTVWKPIYRRMSEKAVAKARAAGEKVDMSKGAPRKYAGAYPAQVWTFSQTRLSVDDDAQDKWDHYVPSVISKADADTLVREARGLLAELAADDIVSAAASVIGQGDDDEDDEGEDDDAPAAPEVKPGRVIRGERAPGQKRGPEWRIEGGTPITEVPAARTPEQVYAESVANLSSKVPAQSTVLDGWNEGEWVGENTTKLTEVQRRGVQAWALRFKPHALGQKQRVIRSTLEAYNETFGWLTPGRRIKPRPTDERVAKASAPAKHTPKAAPRAQAEPTPPPLEGDAVAALPEGAWFVAETPGLCSPEQKHVVAKWASACQYQGQGRWFPSNVSRSMCTAYNAAVAAAYPTARVAPELRAQADKLTPTFTDPTPGTAVVTHVAPVGDAPNGKTIATVDGTVIARFHHGDVTDRPEPEPEPEVDPRKRALSFLRGIGYTAKAYPSYDAAWRAWADDQREVAAAKAEEDCRGKLLSTKGQKAYEAGRLRTLDLFKGNWANVKNMCSDELIAWFAKHGRPTGEDYGRMLERGGVAGSTRGDARLGK